MAFKVLFIIGVCFVPVTLSANCASGWQAHDNSCYKYVGDQKNFAGAQGACRSLDGHGKVVEIGTTEENNFVANMVKSNGGDASWIGLTDKNSEGHWKLVTQNLDTPVKMWGPNEPNNSGGDEDCAAILLSFGGKWDDQNCNDRYNHFVCEVVGSNSQPGGNNNPHPTTSPQHGGSSGNYPFKNTDLSWEQRVNDLVGRLTLDEIQQQMTWGGDGQPAPSIDRLGIKYYQWWTGCNRGDVWAPGDSTGFPQAIGLAASFQPKLRFRVAEATAKEVRAKHTQFMKEGSHKTHGSGLSCFSPNLDIMKHPFWGRNQETCGEDPYMARVNADQFIKGLQGDHSRYVRASAGCKHFAVHSGPEQAHNGGHDRKSFDSKASMYDMRMTYLPGFRQCVESGTLSFMSSYNSINGVPVAANHWLLTELLRDEWKFKGYVLADAGAIEAVWWNFHYTSNSVDTVAKCVNAGINIETSVNQDHPMFLHLTEAVHNGKVSEAKVRETVKPLFYTRMRLGEFDPPQYNPYMSLDLSVVESQAHQDLAVEAAMKSFVLLKNNGALPLKNHHYNNVAVVGPFSNEMNNLFGDYAPGQSWKYRSNVMDAMKHIASNVHHGDGCDIPCKNYNPGQVTSQLNGVDLIFVALGTGQQMEQEGTDKFDYGLPGHQRQLLYDVLDHSGGKPVIVLLFTGSALDISFMEADSRVSAVLECFFPAQGAGKALGHVLLNDAPNAVPAGRLPFTWYKSEHDIGDINDYSMSGKTYRYLHSSTVPLYPFGYGLSYTSFHYSGLSVSGSVQAGHDLTGTVTVHNTGQYDADEAVQIYIKWEKAGLPAPNLQLAWYDRVFVAKGGSSTVHFKVEAKTMALWINNKWEIPAGPMKLFAGGQQPNQHKTVPSNVLSADFSIQGTNHPGSLIG